VITKLAIIILVIITQLGIWPNMADSLKNKVSKLPESKIKNQKDISEIEKDHLLKNYKLSALPFQDNQNPLNIEAKSALVMDVDTDYIMYEKDKDTPRSIASITKIMTAMVILDTNPDLLKTVTVKTPYLNGANIKLKEGEKLTFLNLFNAAMIASANDAVYALAEDTFSSIDNCVLAMNEKAQSLHLENTKFFNPTGLDKDDDPNIQENNQSTAFELAQIFDYSTNYSLIWKTLPKGSLDISSIDDKYHHHVAPTNQILGEFPGILGGKTGYTFDAGQSLVIITKRNNHRIVTVILSSPDRFLEAKKLTNWSFYNFSW
jgi:D-alanyl-D-alanine carboxypeptidase